MIDESNLSRTEREYLINEWIFNEEHRAILKRSWVDGKTYEKIAEEFDCSRDRIARLVPKLHEIVMQKTR